MNAALSSAAVVSADAPPVVVPRLSPLSPPAPHFHLAAFDGPLDLLLHLIRTHQVEITDIPIAEITQQYLEHVAVIEALDLAEAGEYLVLAATLIEIKSRMLLPAPPPLPGEDEPEDPRAELVAKLLEYEMYRGTTETLREWEELRRQLFFRGALENADDYLLPTPEGEANVTQLYLALHRLLTEAGVDDKPVTTITPRKRVSLRLKMLEIARRITASGSSGMQFEDLFDLPCPRYDIVLTFLALLELLRGGRIRVDQQEVCGAIWLFGIVEESGSRV
jgi:segregation and condensation protein A